MLLVLSLLAREMIWVAVGRPVCTVGREVGGGFGDWKLQGGRGAVRARLVVRAQGVCGRERAQRIRAGRACARARLRPTGSGTHGVGARGGH